MITNLCINEYDPLCGDHYVHTRRCVQPALIGLLALGAEHEWPREGVNKESQSTSCKSEHSSHVEFLLYEC